MRRSPLDDLRLAVDCLPDHTRRAMLDGIRANDIIVGAYTHDGGICPMLAAHRHGGRTSFISFAKSWDRFTRARGPRKASPRELRILESMLVTSLTEQVELDGVIAEHQALARERREREARQTGLGWLTRPRRREIAAARSVVERERELV